MRIRADSVFVSSLLFTTALLSLVPAALWNALAGRDKVVMARLDAGFRAEAQTAGLGIPTSRIAAIQGNDCPNVL
jgi:hypothetical protein